MSEYQKIEAVMDFFEPVFEKFEKEMVKIDSLIRERRLNGLDVSYLEENSTALYNRIRFMKEHIRNNICTLNLVEEEDN